MFLACWSVKGGSGTTVVVAALSLVLARRDRDVLAVDLAGDLPAVLGLPDTEATGVSDWLAVASDTPAGSLARLEVDVAPGVRLLPRGQGRLPSGDPSQLLASVLASDPRQVVIDCGTLDPDDAGSGSRGDLALSIASSATLSVLVTRPCYVALRRALRAPVRPSHLVVVSEPGRSLDGSDVEDVLGVPMLAEVDVEPAIARAVDAGLMASRLPRAFERALRSAA